MPPATQAAGLSHARRSFAVSPPTLRSMMTKRKSTKMAPAYTITWMAARKCAWSVT